MDKKVVSQIPAKGFTEAFFTANASDALKKTDILKHLKSCKKVGILPTGLPNPKVPADAISGVKFHYDVLEKSLKAGLSKDKKAKDAVNTYLKQIAAGRKALLQLGQKAEKAEIDTIVFNIKKIRENGQYSPDLATVIRRMKVACNGIDGTVEGIKSVDKAKHPAPSVKAEKFMGVLRGTGFNTALKDNKANLRVNWKKDLATVQKLPRNKKTDGELKKLVGEIKLFAQLQQLFSTKYKSAEKVIVSMKKKINDEGVKAGHGAVLK